VTRPPATTSAQERALQLLWAGDTRGSRGPARGLSLERIVAAAIEVVERDGVAAMSLRRVAAHLGVGAASIYTYVPGRAELEALMLDAVAIGRVLPHERPGDWRAKLQALAYDDWQEIRQHPWVLELAAGEQAPGPNMLRWLDSALRIFDGTGLGEAEKVSAIETVDAYVRGLARLRREEAGTPEDVRRRDEALGRLVDFDRYPALQRALAAGVAPYAGDQFDFGLQRLLDGIERLVAARSA
jgi:AcrR family transcriptional regulator